MRKFYDPEYDRTIDETAVRQQYEWFAQQTWFHKTFEQFAEDNFTEIKEDKDMTNRTNFELNGVRYESNEKGNYFYKSTGNVDKKGNPVMMRISRAVFEQAFDEYIEQANDEAEADEWQEVADKELEARIEKQEASDKQAEETVKTSKKVYKEEKIRKPRKSKDVAHEGNGVTLTAKQVDFLKEMSKTSFYENGTESALWCDTLVDEIGGQFAGKPMTVGAIVSTLKEKNLITTGVERVNGKKAKFFEFTDLGKAVLVDLGLE